MGEAPQENLTLLLSRSREGDQQAYARLFEVVYNQIHDIARSRPHVGRYGDTLQPTALANEAYLLLARRLDEAVGKLDSNRRVFFLVVAQAMREILRNHWKAKRAEKRGGGAAAVALPSPDSLPGIIDDEHEFGRLDEALRGLQEFNEDWHDVVLLRHFAGMTIEQAAETLGVALSTVKDRWKLARAWLARDIDGSSENPM